MVDGPVVVEIHLLMMFRHCRYFLHVNIYFGVPFASHAKMKLTKYFPP